MIKNLNQSINQLQPIMASSLTTDDTHSVMVMCLCLQMICQ